MNDALVDSTFWNPSWAWTAGGIVSKVSEMMNWIQAVVGGRFLSQEMQTERFSNMILIDSDESHTVYSGLGIMDMIQTAADRDSRLVCKLAPLHQRPISLQII